MKNIGAIASIQPADLAADLPWLEDRLGTERAATEAFRWKDLKSAGVQMAGGSDAPYGTPGPLKGIYVAVTRQNEKGLPGGGWQSNQCLSRLDAVRLFTIDAAFANFEEKVKGTLESGKYADFIVLSRDIFSCTPADLLRTNVELTVVGGKTVFASSRYAREHRSEG
jgi:predicted amidohydrolase YtcJ